MKTDNKISRALSVSRFVLLLTLLNLIVFHLPLYQFVSDNLPLGSLQGMATLLSVLAIIFLVSLFLFSLVALVLPFLLKPLSIVFALLNAAAAYFMMTYHVVLDKTMMGNILNTRNEESLDFLTPSFFVYFVLLGVLPSWLIYKTKIKKRGQLRLVLQVLASFAAGGLFIYLNASSWLWIDKHAKTLGGKILPWSYVMNTARFYSEQSKGTKEQQLLPPARFSNDKKQVVVLVIGETARAQNFSLYGYSRQTNPLLSKRKGLTVFQNAHACSTYTTASVACILSHTESNQSDFEPLPSYLNRHGVDVIWRTKNWGEPSIKTNEYLEPSDLEVNCKGADCAFDGVLLTGLKQRIKGSTKNKILVVLHTKGSHGPSYFSRYTKDFEVFKPICKTVELDKCTQQELQNAYDNTIMYTDYFLDKTIGLLSELDGMPSTLLYISDHGESLGEFGLYLHGTPYAIAPDFQKKVPFLVWQSNKSSLAANADSYSQANIFHSVLGAFGIESKIYDKSLDVFSHFKVN